jgi:hypothetical protein
MRWPARQYAATSRPLHGAAPPVRALLVGLRRASPWSDARGARSGRRQVRANAAVLGQPVFDTDPRVARKHVVHHSIVRSYNCKFAWWYVAIYLRRHVCAFPSLPFLRDTNNVVLPPGYTTTRAWLVAVRCPFAHARANTKHFRIRFGSDFVGLCLGRRRDGQPLAHKGRSIASSCQVPNTHPHVLYTLYTCAPFAPVPPSPCLHRSRASLTQPVANPLKPNP